MTWSFVISMLLTNKQQRGLQLTTRIYIYIYMYMCVCVSVRIYEADGICERVNAKLALKGKGSFKGQVDRRMGDGYYQLWIMKGPLIMWQVRFSKLKGSINVVEFVWVVVVFIIFHLPLFFLLLSFFSFWRRWRVGGRRGKGRGGKICHTQLPVLVVFLTRATRRISWSALGNPYIRGLCPCPHGANLSMLQQIQRYILSWGEKKTTKKIKREREFQKRRGNPH